MLNREERITAMKEAGILTGNFYAMDVPEGATIIVATADGKQIKYDREGNRVDEFLKKIKDTGFIKEDPHFRRWVMAQTFDILEYGGSMAKYIKRNKGGYIYQFEQTLRELEAIAKMSPGTKRKEREQFFTTGVVIGLCKDYLQKLHEYIEKLPMKKCKGVPYKSIKSRGDIFCKNIEGAVFMPLESSLMRIENTAKVYRTSTTVILPAFREFIKNIVKFDMDDLDLCSAWLSAYKGAGAYYTLMGLIKFHGCRVYKHEGYRWSCNNKVTKLDLADSIAAVKEKAKEINEGSWFAEKEWYMLYGMLKEVIEDNKFDFREKMKEVYAAK